MATKRYEITAGPSKFDLMVSLLDGGGSTIPRRRVQFVLAGELEMNFIEFIVNSLKRMNDLDDLWIFTGFVPGIPHQRDAETANGTFNTHTRKGLVEINHHS